VLIRVALLLVVLGGCHPRTRFDRRGLDASSAKECPTVTKFLALREGMTRAEVERVMLAEGIGRQGADTLFLSFYCYEPERRITTTFVDGKLSTKSAGGFDASDLFPSP
jgi:hypothetical protein